MPDSGRPAGGTLDAGTIAKAVQMATQGVKLRPTRSEATSYIKGFDGSSHTALDLSEASGLEIVSRTGNSLMLRVGSDEEYEALDFDELYRECRVSQASLVEVQKKHLRNPKNVKELGNFVVDPEDDEIHYANFQDVGKVVDTAYGILQSKMKPNKRKPDGGLHGLAESIREGFRGFRRNAKNIEAFLDFIPDASGYGSVLFGALSIVLKAAAAYESLDSLIHNALSDIRSITLEPHNQVLQALRHNKTLHENMSALYASIFGVLRLVTERVFAKRRNKLLRAFTHPEDNGSDLAALHVAMKQKSQDVRNLVASLTVIKLDAVHKDTGHMRPIVEGLRERLESQGRDLQKILKRADVMGNIYNLVVTFDEGDESLSGSPAIKRINGSSSGPASPQDESFEVEELLESKGFPRTMIEDDCFELSNSRNLSRRGGDYQRMRDLSDHNRLLAFVTLDSSMVLMVNGGVGSRDDQLSPVSFVIAKLVTTLRMVQRQNPFIITVAFFCGHHQNDGFSGCRELMITLILQLIDQYRDFSPEILDECNWYLEEKDLGGLCDLYEELCYELPVSVILYCTLDGLSSFSFPGKRLEETQIVIGRLLALARGITKTPNAHIKFLCATPAICPGVEAVFESWDVLDLDDRTTSSGRDCTGWEDGAVSASMMP